jgi:hypothetical protein
MVDWQYRIAYRPTRLPVSFQPAAYNYQALVDQAAPYVAALNRVAGTGWSVDGAGSRSAAWVLRDVRTFAQMMLPLEPVYFAQLHDDESDWGLAARHLNWPCGGRAKWGVVELDGDTGAGAVRRYFFAG